MNLMEAAKENYPVHIVAMSNLLNLLIYLAGTLVIINLGVYYLIPYFLYILILEFRLLKKGCTRCYYYGKVCAFGKGKISSLFFKKDEAVQFCELKHSKLDLFFDSLIALVPVIVSIVLMIQDFSLYLLALCLVIILLTTAGNATIRGKFACRFCRQRELGCPAQQAFQGSNSK